MEIKSLQVQYKKAIKKKERKGKEKESHQNVPSVSHLQGLSVPTSFQDSCAQASTWVTAWSHNIHVCAHMRATSP